MKDNNVSKQDTKSIKVKLSTMALINEIKQSKQWSKLTVIDIAIKELHEKLFNKE